jgi:hypothetical protein
MILPEPPPSASTGRSGSMQRVSAAETALLLGYVLAVPFTLFVPGFLRLWRRREVEVFAVAQIGALVIALAWLAKGNPVAGAVNAAWFVGLGVAWLREGRRRTAPGRI